MSWRYLLTDSNIFVKEDIDRLHQGQRLARKQQRRRHRKTNERLEALEDAVGELRLITGALLATIQDMGGLDVEKFRAHVERIDAEDGVIDGRHTPAPPPKPKPEAPVPRKRR